MVYLRTAPIDPRDLFRGDYVRLRYDASTVPIGAASEDIRQRQQKGEYGGTVYAALALGERGLGEVTTVSVEKPSGLFLKGRLAAPWRFGIFSQQRVGMEYGIEAYYVQQDNGREIEKQQGARSTIQVPLEMEVAVGGDGTAVIKGHRWSPLGIGIEAVESPRLNQPLGRKSAKFRLTLKNASMEPLAVVNLGAQCSLALEPLSWGQAQAVTVPERPASAGGDMIDRSGVFYAKGAGHAATIAWNGGKCNKKDLTLTVPLALARMVGPSGRVIAVDLQEQMLRRVRKRADRAGLSSRIELHQCAPETLGVSSPADFILSFWMVHEVKDRPGFLRELRGLMNPQARFLVAEPRLHVSAKDVQRTVDLAEEAGLTVIDHPKIGMSRTVLFKRTDDREILSEKKAA